MKLQVNVSDEMCKNIDFYAKKMGISRSALCAVLIGQGLMAYDKSMEVVDNFGKELGEKLREDYNKIRN